MTGMPNIRIFVGVGLVAGSALVATPLMSRYWADEQLTLASIALLAHSLLGAIDLYRPIIVRRVSFDQSFATPLNLFLPSVCSAFGIAFILVGVGLVAVDDGFHGIILSIGATILIYGFYSPLWGFLDGTLRMAETYLVRSLSISVLYLSLGLASLFGATVFIYIALVSANILAAFLFWWKTRGKLSTGGLTVNRTFWVETFNIFVQNIARSINDFGDRVASTFFLPPSLAGGYILLSDFSSRANFPSQLASAYLYPVLCHSPEKSKGFLYLGVVVSAGIILSSIGLYLFGHDLFTLYFGANRNSMFWAFCCLLSCFGIYALSFFGQAVLRSRSLDQSLSLSLLIPAGIGIAIVVASLDGMGLANIMMLALVSKASAVLMMVRLLPIYRVPCALGLTMCAIGAGFIISASPLGLDWTLHGIWN